MKSQSILFGILVLLAASSCKERLSYTPNMGTEPIELFSTIGDTTDNQSQAYSRALVDNSKALAGITFLRKDDANGALTTVNFSGSPTITGTRAAGAAGAITFDPKQFYDDPGDKTSYLVGFYPAARIDRSDFVWALDGVNDIILSAPYNVGKVSAQKKVNMEFQHQLARVEVVVQARVGENLNDIRAAWGKITAIDLIDTSPELRYNYTNNSVNINTMKGVIRLTGGAGYNLGTPTATIDVPANGSTAVYAAAMIAPQSSNKLTFRVRVAGGKVSSGIVQAEAAGPIEAGKVHRVVLSLGAPVVPPQSYESVVINGLRWAKGNLIATSVSDNHSVQIGQWNDYGLYFQFGSLIGWKGGHTQWGGTGVGAPDGVLGTTNDQYTWGPTPVAGNTFSFAREAMVWPKSMTNKPTAYPSEADGVANKWYFSHNERPYQSRGARLTDFPGFMSGELAANGVGDPCRYYLGGKWRLPSAEDMGNLLNNLQPNGVDYSWASYGYWGVNTGYGIDGRYSNAISSAGFNAAISPNPNRGNYLNTKWYMKKSAGTPPDADGLFAPGAGFRAGTTGYFSYCGRQSGWWTNMTWDGGSGFYYFILSDDTRISGRNRPAGMQVRCVSGATLSTTVVDADPKAQDITLTVVNTEGAEWTLTKDDPTNAYTIRTTSGTGDGKVTVSVSANTTSQVRSATFKLSAATDRELTPTVTITQRFFDDGVNVNGLIWAKGNLVAADGVAGGIENGTNGTKVKIGAPTDGGLYFQFGSLIGWKGGNAASLGRGVGIPHGTTPTTPMPNGSFWGLASAYSWENDAMVWPDRYTVGAATWPTTTANDYYFGLNTDPYNKIGQPLSEFANWQGGWLISGRNNVAVGDPCRYYLGGKWRTPTAEDWGNLFCNKFPNGTVGDDASWKGKGLTANWGYGAATKSVVAGMGTANNMTPGVGIYANTTAANATEAAADPNAVFFPASGYRSVGDFNLVGQFGYSWAASVYDSNQGFYVDIKHNAIYAQGSGRRSYGFPVRCVREQ